MQWAYASWVALAGEGAQSFTAGSTTPRQCSPQTYIVWGKGKAVGFRVWTGGFAVIAGIRNDDHRKACLGTAELHRTYCLVSLARHSGGSKKR